LRDLDERPAPVAQAGHRNRPALRGETGELLPALGAVQQPLFRAVAAENHDFAPTADESQRDDAPFIELRGEAIAPALGDALQIPVRASR